ncbi:hypothetical protein FA10DRAFT_263720 [Acaromyces ingoldii]|uniref:J domain-containing protein n=1 Tax=Acaromyces ingoldii TaxID=215250 RepID=A0A316YUQ0_9BASI|nr:hypothetical protein FA10DRAFT_263720 [Acaromyces ingoldii]PWN92999.1 hypothetical protein FA10DRAFT_263720 [Acaromyces ingoldii]
MSQGIKPSRLRFKAKAPRSPAEEAQLPPDLQEDEEEILQAASLDAGPSVAIPKRWLDAAREGDGRRSKMAGGMHEMDEEEYAEFVRAGHHSRTGRGAEEREEEEKEKSEKREREQRDSEAEAENRRRRRRRRRRKREEKTRAKEQETNHTSSRQAFDGQWSLGVLSSVQDVPWPVHPPSSPLNRINIDHFLFSGSSESAGSRRLRTALRRFHPDRFLQAHTFASEQAKDEILEKAKTVAQILADIVVDRRNQ